jgi:hypothetical protein
MKENNRFYTLAESPKEIVSCKDARYFIHKRDWGWVKGTKAGKLKVFFIDIDDNEAHIEEVPPEFLALDDSWAKYETSVNFTIHGQFFTGELAWRAHKRMFTWDMYVWRLPVSEWLPARDVPQTREILENYFPLKTGDTGPAGGIIIKCDNTSEPGYHCVEAAPFDAGWATWHDAQRLCGEFSHIGISGWRLPTVDELRIFASALRARLRAQNVLQTTETVLNWSSARSGETAVAVVTQENEDFYQYQFPYTLGGSSGGYYKSSNGPYRGHEKELPVTHCYPVRPVRDFYAKRIVKE